MKQMEEMILREGKVLPGDILKVGSFLNQNINTELLAQPMYELALSGNVTNKYKGFMDGKTVFSFSFGSVPQ